MTRVAVSIMASLPASRVCREDGIESLLSPATGCSAESVHDAGAHEAYADQSPPQRQVECGVAAVVPVTVHGRRRGGIIARSRRIVQLAVDRGIFVWSRGDS